MGRLGWLRVLERTALVPLQRTHHARIARTRGGIPHRLSTPIVSRLSRPRLDCGVVRHNVGAPPPADALEQRPPHYAQDPLHAQPAPRVGVGANGCGIHQLAGVEHAVEERHHATTTTAAATVPRVDQLH